MERNSKLLSVIVPVYKAEKYLHRCVDSIIAQTWSNLEIILVDDGSPDNSGAICNEYATRDSRIRVIHKPNGGVSSARNAGIDAATGEYIAFVDSDDYIAPDMYEKLFGVLKSENAIAVCDCYLHYDDKDLYKCIYEVHDDRIEFLANFLISDIGGSCWNMIAPINIIDSLRFPEHLNSGEDRWYVLRLLCKAPSIVKVNEPLYYYDQSNNSSITHSISNDMDLKVLGGYDENRSFLIETGLFEYLKAEWSWAVLRHKSTFVLTPKRFSYYRSILPEANKYVSTNPLLSERIKTLMRLLDCHLDFIAAPLVYLYKIKQCVTHI